MELFRRDSFIEYLSNLLERKAQVFECENAIEPGKLAGCIVAVPSRAINVDRLEESHLVVVAQGLDRNPAQLREITNSNHPCAPYGSCLFVSRNCFYVDSTISRNGRVKPFVRDFVGFSQVRAPE